MGTMARREDEKGRTSADTRRGCEMESGEAVAEVGEVSTNPTAEVNATEGIEAAARRRRMRLWALLFLVLAATTFTFVARDTGRAASAVSSATSRIAANACSAASAPPNGCLTRRLPASRSLPRGHLQHGQQQVIAQLG